MDKDTAKALMDEYLALGAATSRATEVAKRLTDQTEREAVLRSIGSIMNIVYVELMRPIIKQHPELDPDR